MKLALISYRYATGFFGNNDSQRICFLRDTKCSAMTQAQLFRYIQIMRNGKNTSGSLDTLIADYHGAIVQRTVLEKDVFYQTLVDIGVYNISGTSHYQRSYLSFAHIHTSHYNRHNILFAVGFFISAREKTEYTAAAMTRTK